MEILAYLIPAALFLGLLGLGAFFWALKSGQFEDLDGAAERILINDDDLPPPSASGKQSSGGGTPPDKDGGPDALPFAIPCH